MEETRTSLSEKFELLEQQVMDTVHGATNAVHDTVEDAKAAVHETVADVKDAVHHTVEDVKGTFDLTHQMQKHPWAMLGGSIVLGFLGAKLLERADPDPLRNGHWMPPQPWQAPSAADANGNGHRGTKASEEPGVLASLTHQFGPEIDRLKGMAVGAALSVVRDMIRNALPDPMKPQVAEVMDNITVKLGGTPMRGPLLSNGDSDAKCNPSEMGRAMGPT